MTDTIRLSGPTDVIVSVPLLCGFRPENSLVLIALSGKRVGLTARVDLPDMADDEGRAAFTVAMMMAIRDSGATGLYAIQYGADLTAGRVLAEDLQLGADTLGLSIMDSLYVQGDWFWSLKCTNAACCPPEGSQVPAETDGSLRLAAEAAAAGLVPLANRQEMVDSIAVNPAVVDDVVAHLLMSPPCEPFDPYYDLPTLTRLTSQPAPVLDLSDAVCLLRLLSSPDGRDAALRHLAQAESTVALQVTIQLARMVPPPYDAPALALLAAIAYLSGDGGLANAALDRALSTDPGNTLARLIGTCITQVVPPSVARGALVS